MSASTPATERTSATGATGSRPATAIVPRARRLAGERPADVLALFATLPAALAIEMPRRTRGHVVALAGTDVLPAVLRRALIALANGPFGLWRGKSFDGATGANRVGLPGLERALGFYRVAGGEAYDGAGPALVLDYDVARNPAPLRRIRGELRRLAPARWLGRMTLGDATSRRTLLYFELEEIA